MNCPSCKSDNPAGVAYCQMCYESFNRSAADTYLRSVRREQYEEIKKRAQARSPIDDVLARAREIFREIDVASIRAAVITLFRGRLAFVTAGVLLGLVLLVLLIVHWSGLRYSVFGRSMRYSAAAGTQSRYLVGFQNKLKTWSERDNNLDSPLEEFQTDDIGNVEVTKTGRGSHATLEIHPNEWIVVKHQGEANDSHTVPLSDASLTPQSIPLDSDGFVAHRQDVPTLRLGRGLGFLVPVFPDAPLRPNRQWTERAQWIEKMGDWKVVWSGQLHWTLEGEAPCGDATCAHLTYRADVTPKILAVPPWAEGATSHASYHGEGHGDALFDPKHGVLVANNFIYSGVFRVPLHDLGRIPIELRVGRRIQGLPGDLLVQFQNRIDVRRN